MRIERLTADSKTHFLGSLETLSIQTGAHLKRLEDKNVLEAMTRKIAQ